MPQPEKFDFADVELKKPYQIRVLTLHFEREPTPEDTLVATLEVVNLFDLESANDRYDRLRSGNKRQRSDPAAVSQAVSRHGQDKAHSTNASSPDADTADKVGYEAVSWAWGEETESKTLTVRVNGQPREHRIRPNLDACLRKLRYRNRDRRLWVDAVCIDQGTPAEKNQQVAIMREIYSRATRAIVWLGVANQKHPPLEEDLKDTFEFIEERLLKRGLHHIINESDHIRNLGHLQAIMMRPWFNRRWVIQEIALAREATVHCAQYTIPWQEFSYAVSLFVDAGPALDLAHHAGNDRSYTKGMFSEISKTGAAELTDLQSSLFRSSVQSTQSLASLEFLVSRLPMFECGTPHDAIYSLLAVAKDTAPFSGDFWYAARLDRYLHEVILDAFQTPRQDGKLWGTENLGRAARAGRRVAMRLGEHLKQKGYPIRYEDEPIEAYAHFMQFVIDSSESLDMICRPWAPRPSDENKRPIRLPSWIQDRSKRAFCSAPTSDGDDLSRIDRRNADPLVGLPGRSMYHASGDAKASQRTFSIRRRSENDHRLHVKGFVVGSVSETEDPAIGGNIPRAWLTFAGWRDWRQDPPPEFCRLLVANREPSRDYATSTPPSYYTMVCKRILKPAFQNNVMNIDTRYTQTEDPLEQRYLKRMRAVCTERVLFRMKGRKGINDALALGPRPSRSRHDVPTNSPGDRGVQENDLVCILYGCSVPVILRPFRRMQDALQREIEARKREFAQNFFRSVKRIQRMFRRRLLLKMAAHARFVKTELFLDKPPKLEDHNSLSQKPFPTGAEESVYNQAVKEIEQSISEEIKRDHDKKRKDDEAVDRFEEFSQSLASLPNGLYNKLGRELTFEYLQLTRGRKWDLLWPCPGAKPARKPLHMPDPAKDSREHPAPEIYHELVGECFVDGIMDGEALDHRKSGPAKTNRSAPPEPIIDVQEVGRSPISWRIVLFIFGVARFVLLSVLGGKTIALFAGGIIKFVLFFLLGLEETDFVSEQEHACVSTGGSGLRPGPSGDESVIEEVHEQVFEIM